MIATTREVIRKIRRDGLKRALKAAGRRFHSVIFKPHWDFELVPSILESILKGKGTLTVVQIGANVGDTGSDQIYGFLARHCLGNGSHRSNAVKAALVEPVGHLFQQLSANYAGFSGVICENVAIAEAAGTRNFYRLREGIDLSIHGLPAWAEQLGSFVPEQLDSLWIADPSNHQLREFVQANTVIEPIQCVTFHQLLEKHGIREVDLLIIDTEGYDYQILRTIDLQRLRPTFINYEHIHLNDDEPRCRDLLSRHGYHLLDHGQDTLCELRTHLSATTRLREWLYSKWLKFIREPKTSRRQPSNETSLATPPKK